MNPLLLTLLGQMIPRFAPLPAPIAEDDTFDVVTGTGPWQFNLSANDSFEGAPTYQITSESGPGTVTIDPDTGILTFVEAVSIYTPTAAVFDGTNDYLLNATQLIDAADTKFFAATFAVKRTALSGNGIFQRIAGGQISLTGVTRWSIGFEPSDHATVGRRDCLFLELRNPSGTVIAYLNSTIPFAAGTLYRVAVSADRNTRAYRLRVDNVDRLSVITDSTDTAQVIDYTVSHSSIGGRTQGDQKFPGEIADLWIDFHRAPDFAQAAEWERFFFPTTHALQWKGNDGSVPYGVSPTIYQSGPIGQWHVNRGHGGGFALNGALSASASPPAGAEIPQLALSDVAITVTGTNAVIANQGSDNWPITWASDGSQIAAWGDGTAPDTARASMGMAKIDAVDYAGFVALPTFIPLATTRASGRGAGVNLIAFSATPPNVAAGTARGGKCYGVQALPGGVIYALVGAQSDDDGDASGTQTSNDQMENVTLIKSADNGATWTHVPAITWDTLALGKIWILPAGLNMGRANAAAQDEYLYWYAAGARPLYTGQTTDFAYGSDDIMLVRVPAAGVETLANWEVFTGMSGSTPQWSSTFTNWAPVPGDDGNGWTLANPLNNQYPNAFYLPEFDEIIIVRNNNGRQSWSVTTQTNLEFWRSTSKKPWGPFELVKRFTDWRPYDPDVPGAATSTRGLFFFSVPPRWVPKATGTTTKSIACALSYTGRNKGASGTFWDAWNSVPMTLTLTGS